MAMRYRAIPDVLDEAIPESCGKPGVIPAEKEAAQGWRVFTRWCPIVS